MVAIRGPIMQHMTVIPRSNAALGATFLQSNRPRRPTSPLAIAQLVQAYLEDC